MQGGARRRVAASAGRRGAGGRRQAGCGAEGRGSRLELGLNLLEGVPLRRLALAARLDHLVPDLLAALLPADDVLDGARLVADRLLVVGEGQRLELGQLDVTVTLADVMMARSLPSYVKWMSFIVITGLR